MRTNQEIEAELDLLDDQDSNDYEIERLRDTVRELLAERSPKLSGVYCVYLDADIVGAEEPVVWAFVYEGDAHAVKMMLLAAYGEGKAWYSYEPIADSLNDPDLVRYLKEREVYQGSDDDVSP